MVLKCKQARPHLLALNAVTKVLVSQCLGLGDL